MKKHLHVLIFLFLLCSPLFTLATHIVGGTLTYVHNGGSSYTITLKLFRDCGAGTAAFPGSVTITVLGVDGTPFTPSRDITMTLGPVTPVPSSLPPCAQQPNPTPCTQQGLYTTTVNNLPPNPGGYHLYYQQVARNLSLTNVNASGNNVGESFYAYIPGPTIGWNEQFTFANGTTVDNGTTGWSITSGATAPASASVNNNQFQVTGANNASVTWASQVINIASLTGGANLQVNLSESGTLENTDSLFVYYSLNGGPLTLFATNGSLVDDFTNAVASQNGLNGTTVQIFIVAHYGSASPSSEIYMWDNVIVSANNFISNSNPTFNLFPPLFLCLNTPFTFDHAATDADGDSLVYEFYTPYDGDNNAGPLDPTFPNNNPTFTPIVFLPGYSATNPLGGAPLSLNPSTGLLSGTPPALGQYVVGILVKEYRNGVYLSSTLRDFQFNIVNCPQTLAVTIGPQNPTICFGSTSTTITANATGGQPPYTYLWNNVNPSASINVGVGTYSVTVTDAAGCQAFAFVTVTAFTAAINANAGADQTKCITSPSTVVNATVTAASGGIWSGGGGTFSPNTTTLNNLVYTPSAAELSAGFANLILTTTGNGTCPADKDTIRINYSPFTGTVTPAVTPVSCFGGNNGSATINITGGASPFTYFWNTAPSQTAQTISNLSPGTYSVTITDAIGCTNQTTATITQPAILSVNATGSVASCNGGSVSANVSGGTSPYTYLWSPGGQTTSSITGLSAGSYSVTVTDSKGCQASSSASVAPPAPMSVSLTSADVNCFGGANGTATSSVTGGIGPFTYSWAPSGGTGSSANGLAQGTYTLTVTDSRSCTATGTVSISQPAALTATASSTNETCDYLNNGTASVVAGGGTAPYTYNWAPGGQTTVSISSLSAGTYTVLVTDNKGCTRQAFATVTQPAALTASFGGQSNVSCFGGSNGSVTVSASGGTAGYSYSWSPGGASTATASGLSSGTYTVTVTDNNTCQTTNTITITQPAAALSVVTNATNVSCNGGSDGIITAVPSGGTAPYSYSWSPGGQTAITATGLPAGTYTVIATDANGCVANGTRTITEPSALSVSLTGTNINCFGNNNGAITSSVSGGTPAYTYLWSPGGATTANVSGLGTGTYTLTVRDNLNCLQTASLTITQPSTLTVNASATAETCDYLNNGSASAVAAGGTGPYTYLWQPGNQTTAIASGLSSGSYTVSVTDSKGCVTAAVTNVTQPGALGISFSNQVNVSCFGGSNASVTATASGGTPNYTYNWMPGSINGANANGLSAGTYTVTVTDSRACTTQNTIVITQPAAALSVTASSTPASCYDGTNGTVSANAIGGTSPYTSYVWAPGNLVGQNISSLAAGTYTVTVTDSKNCIAVNSVTITQPAQIVPSLSTVSSTCTLPNGSASVSVTGGIAPYSYQWFPTGGTGTTTTPVASGSYTVLVVDANGCSSSGSTNVNDNSGPSASIFATTNVTCNGGSDGTATVGVVGGTGTLIYQWLPIGGNGPVATGLTAGVYTISVTDANGCQSLATTSPPISEPPPIQILVTTNAVSCFGGTNGSATAVASGGTGALTYLWLPVNISGANATNLSAGTYTVQVTDANSCVQTKTLTITQPSAALAVSVSSTPVSCFGGANGTASSVVTGGTTPYNYTWMPGNISGQNISGLTAGTYSINITDANGCAASNLISVIQPTALTLNASSNNSTCGNSNGSATATASGGTGTYNYVWSPGGQSTSIVSGIHAGNYTVQVTDANGCVANTSLVVNNTAGPVVTVTATNNVNCNGASDGSAFTNVTGGAGTITYSWLPSGGNAATGTGLSTGIYTVTVTDANGCQSQATTANITQPAALAVNVNTTAVSCFGGSTGSASASASGGTTPYSYTWLPGGSTGSNISGQSAGTYTVRVTDNKGCILNQPYSITQPAAALTVSLTTTPVSCFGQNNGTATAIVSGGTSPYTYSWSPVTGGNSTLSNLTTGNYTVNVTDSKGCTAANNISVTQPSQALSATASTTAAACFGGSTGEATITTVGGTPNYNYSWSPTGGTGQSAANLSAGNYVVTITDTRSCSTSVALTITQPTALTGSLDVTNATCGFSNGSIAAQITGGTSPYSYAWSNSATTSSINSLNTGTYSVQITDANNCVQTYSTSLSNTPALLASVTSTVNVACFNGSSGSATVSVTQGTAPYSINWLPFGGTSATATGLTAGTYTATITDAAGCTSNSATVNITQPLPLTISIDSVSNVLCNGGTSGEITITPSGGTPAYTYVWSPATGNGPTISNIAAGIYSVTVSDQQNCSLSVSTLVTEPAQLTSAVSSTVNPLCFGEDGSASVNVSGGTIPYVYNWSCTPPQSGSTMEDEPAGTYTCSITDANGCQASTTATITQPTQVITTAGPDAIMCLGATGVVNASANGGTPPYVYTWLAPAVINSGTLPLSITQTTTYTVTAYDQNNCMGLPDTVSGIVYDLNQGSILATGDSLICPGGSAAIFAQVNGNPGPLTFSWTNNLGTGPGAYVVSPVVPTMYVVTVTNPCGAVVKDSIYVSFNPPPTISLEGDTNRICAPDEIQFSDNSITGNINDPINSWAWNFGDGTTSNLQNPVHTYTSPGNYNISLTVTTVGGCTNNNTTAPYNVQAFPYPNAGFSLNSTNLNLPYDQLICTNQSTGATTYVWSFGDGTQTTVQNPQHSYNAVGTFEVQLIATSSQGCADTAVSEIITDADVVFPNAFSPNLTGPNGGAYDPNDLSNNVFFPYTSGVVEYKMQVFNRWGELIFESTDVKIGWDGYYRGKLCQQDVYVWKAYLKLNNGKTYNKTGDITLLQ